MSTDFHHDGPHSPDLTRQAAGELAELVRYLCYSARAGSGGLEYPSDAYDLLGEWQSAAQRMMQLADLTAGFLMDQHAARPLSDSQGRDPGRPVAEAVAQLEYARRAAGDLSERLRAAHNAVSGLSVKEGTDG